MKPTKKDYEFCENYLQYEKDNWAKIESLQSFDEYIKKVFCVKNDNIEVIKHTAKFFEICRITAHERKNANIRVQKCIDYFSRSSDGKNALQIFNISVKSF